MNARAAVALLKVPFFACAALSAGCLSGCHSVDDRPPAWEYISPAIFQPNCATTSCHSRAAAVAGLDFSDPDRGYNSLTGLYVWIVDPNGTLEAGCKLLQGNVVCPKKSRPFVTPYDPSQSRLVNMLRAHAAPRMPPDRPLPDADIKLVESWILEGAKKTWGGSGASDAGVDGKISDAGGDAGTETARADAGSDPGADGSGAGIDGADAGADHAGVATESADGAANDVGTADLVQGQ